MRIRSALVIAGTSVLALVAHLTFSTMTASGTESSHRPECTITGTDAGEQLRGTTGPDVICAGGGKDAVSGRGGDDVIYGGGGNDWIEGDAGDDRIYGGPQSDYLFGKRGDDRLFGQNGRDVLFGETFGADLLVGGRGRDDLRAYDGKSDDRLYGGPRRDRYDADAGDVLRSVEIAPTYS